MKENNDGNDTNVGSIENSIKEDIKIVEDFIDVALVFLPKYSTKKVEKRIDEESYISIKHILSDYKKLKEEFKAIDSECSRLERKEVEMEKIINLMTKYISNITDCPFESEGAYLNCEETCDVITDAECWKQYFINKAKEVK